MLTFYLGFTAILFLLALLYTLNTKPGSQSKPNGSARFLMVTAVIQGLLVAMAISLLVKFWGVSL